MRKLTVVSVHPIHYNDYLFDAVQAGGIQLEVYYTRPTITEYPWKNYLCYDFERPVLDSKLGFFIFNRMLHRKNEVFLIYGWDSILKNLMLLSAMLLGRTYLLFTDTLQTDNSSRSVIKKHIRSFWLKLIFKRAAFVLTTGEIGIKKAEALYNCKNAINFPFCTDLKFFNTTPDFSTFNEQIFFFSSGRLDNNHKGYDVAIKALGILKEKGVSFRYNIAGTGKDMELLKNLCREYGIENDVVFLGWQELDELRNQYGSAHIFLHTSHFDPYPNAILEAMASGLIVVSSDMAGSAIDRIREGENGFTFKDNDINALSNILLSLSAFSNAQLLEMSAAVKKTAQFWDVRYNVEVIKTLLNDKIA